MTPILPAATDTFRTYKRTDDLPAPRTPRSEMRPLGVQRGVVAVAGMNPRVFVKAPEDLAFKIIHQGREVFGIVGLARSTREEAVTGEQMRRAAARVCE